MTTTTQTQWLSDFRNKLKLRYTVIETTPTAGNNSTKSSIIARNVVIFIVLPLLILGTAIAKKTWASRATQSTTFVESVDPITPIAPVSSEKGDIEKALARSALLGAIMNHNAYIIRNGGDAEDLMYINQDWTIDGLPKYVANPSALERFLKQ